MMAWENSIFILQAAEDCCLFQLNSCFSYRQALSIESVGDVLRKLFHILITQRVTPTKFPAPDFQKMDV